MTKQCLKIGALRYMVGEGNGDWVADTVICSPLCHLQPITGCKEYTEVRESCDLDFCVFPAAHNCLDLKLQRHLDMQGTSSCHRSPRYREPRLWAKDPGHRLITPLVTCMFLCFLSLKVLLVPKHPYLFYFPFLFFLERAAPPVQSTGIDCQF